MEGFIFFDSKEREHYLNKRAGEIKFGERIKLISSVEEISTSSARFIIFGIPEDIGIRANYGKPGAAKTWNAFLASFLNTQLNLYSNPRNCAILGRVDCEDYQLEASRILKEESNPQKKLGKVVEKIDAVVTTVVQTIVSAHKTPIIIGGGHNNSYGNIKGTSLALRKPINILNIDAHTDLRKTDYRHSGNGFSYARKEGFLKYYSMFGIHKNYTPQYIFDKCKGEEELSIQFFEDVMAGDLTSQQRAVWESLRNMELEFGIELDTDAIAHFNSSAQTPSGFSIVAIRHFIELLRQHKVLYFHIAEAADSGDGQVGKALSYFVFDFIR